MSSRQLKRENARLAKELAKAKAELRKRKLRAKELAEKYLSVIRDAEDRTDQKGDLIINYCSVLFCNLSSLILLGYLLVAFFRCHGSTPRRHRTSGGGSSIHERSGIRDG